MSLVIRFDIVPVAVLSGADDNVLMAEAILDHDPFLRQPRYRLRTVGLVAKRYAETRPMPETEQERYEWLVGE